MRCTKAGHIDRPGNKKKFLLWHRFPIERGKMCRCWQTTCRPKKREIMNAICGYLNDRKKLLHCCRFGSRARTQCQGQMTSQQNLM